jgi:ADP-heptose:LPS heptosyltransferase
VVSLRAAGLGDLLTAVPALRAVAAAHPDARHVLATSAGLQPLAALIGGIDDVVTTVVEPGATSPRAPVLPPVDVAVNLHGRGPESHRVLLGARPRRLVAFARDDLAVSGPAWDDDEHEVARWCRLVEAAGMPADVEDLGLPAPAGSLPRGVRGATLLHPGAGAPARRWPVERWCALARAERADGHPVAVTVGPGERAIGAAIAAAVGDVAVIDCAADLELLVRVVEAASALVVGDTGVAHLATALRTPSVVLFGPEPPSRWGPPLECGRHVALWAGERGDPHATTPHPGLLALGVLDVLLALRRVRAAPRGRARAGEDALRKGVACES